MADIELNWTTAEVEDGKLMVELEGEIPSGWKQSFERTVTLLARGDWGTVEVKKRTVRVSDVSPGGEDKLRHHLESIVEQANANVRPSESESEAEEDDADGKRGRDSADAQMTDSFRAFAEDAPET